LDLAIMPGELHRLLEAIVGSAGFGVFIGLAASQD
jgi:hypothetical protein